VAFDVNAEILRDLGVPLPVCVRVSLARWMIVGLQRFCPATIRSIMIGRPDVSVSRFCSIPLGDGVSEQDRAAHVAVWAEVEGVVRERAAAYWLIAPRACVYQTMHGELAPADRLFVASYGFCVALLMIDMRRFVDPAFLPLQRQSTASAKPRWVYNDETWKKLMGALSAILCGLGQVVQPIRANVFGTLDEERFCPCMRRCVQEQGPLPLRDEHASSDPGKHGHSHASRAQPRSVVGDKAAEARRCTF
jgi:hypothetical protein